MAIEIKGRTVRGAAQVVEALQEQAGDTPFTEYVEDQTREAAFRHYRRFDRTLRQDDFERVDVEWPKYLYGDAGISSFMVLTRPRGMNITTGKRTQTPQELRKNQAKHSVEIMPGIKSSSLSMNVFVYKALQKQCEYGQDDCTLLVAEPRHVDVFDRPGHREPQVKQSYYYGNGVAPDGELAISKIREDSGVRNSFRPCIGMNPLFLAGVGVVKLPL